MADLQSRTLMALFFLVSKNFYPSSPYHPCSRRLQLLRRASVFLKSYLNLRFGVFARPRHRSNRVVPGPGLRRARAHPRVPRPGCQAAQSGPLDSADAVRSTRVRHVGCPGFRGLGEHHGGPLCPDSVNRSWEVAEAAGQRQAEALEDWQLLLPGQREGTVVLHWDHSCASSSKIIKWVEDTYLQQHLQWTK